MRDATGTTHYVYIPATSQLLEITYPDTRSITYSYNQLGLRETMTDPFGYTLRYTYDTRNRLQSIGVTTSNWEESYQYDKDSDQPLLL